MEEREERYEQCRGKGRTMEERKGQNWTTETGVADKVEKEKPSEKISKASEASFWDFFRGFFPFHFIGHLSLPFFRSDHPSLTWFFLSLFILHLFLVSSSALAVQALSLTYDMEWFLRGSTISPSLSTPSQVFKWSQNVCWVSRVRSHDGNKHLDWGHPLQLLYWCRARPFFEMYFHIILKLLWTVLELVLNQCDLVMEWSFLYCIRITFVSFWDHCGFLFASFWDCFEIILGSFWGRFLIILTSLWDRSWIFWDHQGGPSGIGRESFLVSFKQRWHTRWGSTPPCRRCCRWSLWGG